MTPADRLATRIAPALVVALTDREDAIVEASGGMMARFAVRLVFPAILAEVPNLAAVSLDTISREFGHMTVDDFLAIFAERAKTL